MLIILSAFPCQKIDLPYTALKQHLAVLYSIIIYDTGFRTFAHTPPQCGW